MAGNDEANGLLLDGVVVLIVEDTWHLAEAIQQALEAVGAVVAGATGSLEEAGQIASASEIDAAVMDLSLSDGEATDLALRLVGNGVKVVILSARALPEELCGKVHAYLPKPASPEQLMVALAGQLRAPT